MVLSAGAELCFWQPFPFSSPPFFCLREGPVTRHLTRLRVLKSRFFMGVSIVFDWFFPPFSTDLAFANANPYTWSFSFSFSPGSAKHQRLRALPHFTLPAPFSLPRPVPERFFFFSPFLSIFFFFQDPAAPDQRPNEFAVINRPPRDLPNWGFFLSRIFSPPETLIRFIFSPPQWHWSRRTPFFW